MFTQKNINIFDFDIYARRISFFFNGKEKIGSVFGFVLTFLYVITLIILFIYYFIRIVKRKDLKTSDSTIYAQGTPSIEINPNLLYFAFGLEDPKSKSRYIDETIYYPIIYFINMEKVNGTLVTKNKLNINAERCKVEKFGENYIDLFTKDELNNSYCLEDYNFTLAGGFKYDVLSYIRIKIFPCKNTTENNFHCKPQNIIDSYLSSTYFSMVIKDIGLNPLNYTFPIVPTIENIYDTLDKSIYRDFLIYFGITEVHTDIGLLTNKIIKNVYLQFRKYYSTFFFREESDYHNGKEIFVCQIRLEEFIHVQKRIYTKISEIFSVIGGFMQFITNIFLLLTILTKNVNIEKKILNNLFNFNMKQQKMILSIKYAKKLNYLNPCDKRNLNLFIPYGAFKSLNPYKNILSNNNSKKNEIISLKRLSSFRHSLKKAPTGNIGHKLNEMKRNLKLVDNDNDADKVVKEIARKNRGSIVEQNKSRQFLVKETELNENQISNRIYIKKYKKNCYNNTITDYKKDQKDEKVLLSDVNINIFDYFCRFGKLANKKVDIKLFTFAVNFYRNQLSIINFFNIIFFIDIMLPQQTNEKKNFLNEIFEIPLNI